MAFCSANGVRVIMCASPGVLVDGVSDNPFDLLIQPACRVDDEKAQALFSTNDLGKLR